MRMMFYLLNDTGILAFFFFFLVLEPGHTELLSCVSVLVYKIPCPRLWFSSQLCVFFYPRTVSFSATDRKRVVRASYLNVRADALAGMARGRWQARDLYCSVEEWSLECTSMFLRLRSRLYATKGGCGKISLVCWLVDRMRKFWSRNRLWYVRTRGTLSMVPSFCSDRRSPTFQLHGSQYFRYPGAGYVVMQWDKPPAQAAWNEVDGKTVSISLLKKL